MTSSSLLNRLRHILTLHSNEGLQLLLDETEASKANSPEEWMAHADFALWELALHEELAKRGL